MVKCQDDGIVDKTCDKRAEYGIINTTATYCPKHKNMIIKNDKTIKMVNYTKSQCKINDCNKEARYGPKLPKDILETMSKREKLHICTDHHYLFPDYVMLADGLCILPECYNSKSRHNIYCSKCGADKPDYLYIPRYICDIPICQKNKKGATFNIYGNTIPIKCKDHATVEMVDVVSKMCLTCDELCKQEIILPSERKRPSYKDPATGLSKYADYCDEHRDKKTMIDVISKRCAFEGCTHQPSFNYADLKPLYCGIIGHKKEGMINVHGEKCGEIDPITLEKCTRSQIYGLPFGKVFKCSYHKTPEMIRIYKILCDYPLGCEIEPTFGFPDKKFTRCAAHKENGMITRNPLCATNCGNHASYGYPNTLRTHCGGCKLEGMVLKNQICIKPNCTKSAAFGVTKREYCGEHRDRNTMFDLTNIYCKECKARALYGIPGNRVSHCERHAKKGMIFRPKIRCEVKGCGRTAVYGVNNDIKRCEEHVQDGDTNLIEKPCANCNFDAILDLNDYCLDCARVIKASTRLVKQTKIMDFLDAYGFPGETTDKVPEDSCDRERPDRVFYFGNIVVILECDEEQHKQYTAVCERIRMFNISQIYGETPVYFIRYNPDKFNTGNEPFEQRSKLLLSILDDILKEKIILPFCKCAALYLFYDGWKGIIPEWKIISERYVEVITTEEQ